MNRPEPEAADRPVRVALTGGIASGKSTVENLLREIGVAVLDTDQVAHTCMKRGKPAFAAVVDTFGSEVVGSDGELDRTRLGQIVFSNDDKRQQLNQLVHPLVRQEVDQWLEQQQVDGHAAVVAIPLLFEAGMEQGWDAILCVDADPERIRGRLADRGLTPTETEARLQAQLPAEEKRQRSDYVLLNNGTIEELKTNLLTIWREITQKEQDHE